MQLEDKTRFQSVNSVIKPPKKEFNHSSPAPTPTWYIRLSVCHYTD